MKTLKREFGDHVGAIIATRGELRALHSRDGISIIAQLPNGAWVEFISSTGEKYNSVQEALLDVNDALLAARDA